ncbi:uncharacterized protein BP01DRAFT_17779 [Aspergillus saccharolyticus JOP 1030-1]|uniref:Subtelomeric hrmA-associated cluster protein AFUB-079030/YDR124W-like helical bundle domain-containing protein n=1 Tax=Aspergillus saccharolyticus JOP 1030-1 TaxID=1450539 RepID=A0A318ZQA9_9EURO|nr:hypothetical protein BP01DRAFT_17779 [Aspergillus saccharolyticus JOP 1030-1]PYH46593.1 hypothetical protein BP01DRAFT_17779 [Aspergillus saccharolyticus JOP 1030-1]
MTQPTLSQSIIAEYKTSRSPFLSLAEKESVRKHFAEILEYLSLESRREALGMWRKLQNYQRSQNSDYVNPGNGTFKELVDIFCEHDSNMLQGWINKLRLDAHSHLILRYILDLRKQEEHFDSSCNLIDSVIPIQLIHPRFMNESSVGSNLPTREDLLTRYKETFLKISSHSCRRIAAAVVSYIDPLYSSRRRWHGERCPDWWPRDMKYEIISRMRDSNLLELLMFLLHDLYFQGIRSNNWDEATRKLSLFKHEWDTLQVILDIRKEEESGHTNIGLKSVILTDYVLLARCDDKLVWLSGFPESRFLVNKTITQQFAKEVSKKRFKRGIPMRIQRPCTQEQLQKYRIVAGLQPSYRQ